MAEFTIFSCNFPFIFLLIMFYFLTLTLVAKPISSSSLRALQNNPNFDSDIALAGDAGLIDGGVNLTRSAVPSSGLVLRQKPFKFLGANHSNPTSFSTTFTFSMTPGNGDGILLALVPRDFGPGFSGKGPFGLDGENRFLGIEFDTEMNGNMNDLNANHVGVDLDSFVSATAGNVSKLHLVLNSGEKLQAWIDYDASSKRLEIRLGKSGESRPDDPIIAYAVDLLEMWSGEDVYVGISSSNSNGNSSQISSVYSWTFRLRNVPKSPHSFPVNPRGYLDEHGEHLDGHKRRVCPLAVLAGMIFMTGCGALVAFVGLFLWAIIISKHTVFPAEFLVKPVDFSYEKINPAEFPVEPVDFRYEKINVVVEKNANGLEK